MPGPVHAMQPSFAAGELAPALQGRVDFAKYAAGLTTALNGFIHPTGGFSSRPGMRYVAAAKYSNKKCRLIPFEFSSTQTYMLEFGDLYIRFYTNGGQIQNSGSPYEIASPYIEADLPLLKVVQSANTLYIVHPLYAPRTLVRASDTNWTLAAFPFKNGPFMLANASTINTMRLDFTAAPPTLNSSFNIFTPDYVGAWFRVQDTVTGQSASNPLTNAVPISNILRGYKQWRISTTGTWKGTIQIQYSFYNTASPVFWQVMASFSSNNDSNFNTFGAIPKDVPVYVRVTAALAAGSGPVNVNLNCDDFIFDYRVQVSAYVSPTQVQVTNTTYASMTTISSDDWSEGSWSVVRGWPSVIGFYQDRLCLASTASELIGLWMSQTGDYPNFGISDPLVDSDAISINLNSRKLNKVENLLSLTELVPLTSSGEFSVAPGASGVLSPTSLDQKVQGYRGCSSVPALIIGNTAIFVQPMGTVIRNLGYQFANDTFTGDNLSLLSSHLFQNFTITELAYQQEPDSLVWALRSDGSLLTMTYMPEQQVIAWTHHSTDGTFESIASIPNVDYDELWVVVNRSNGRFIERMAQRMPTFDIKDQFCVDCGITYSGAPATVISGLDYLDGKSVVALADGSVQGPFMVAGGRITLTVAAAIVHIGLPFTVDFETLNFEAQLQDGSSQGRRQRIAQVTLRLLNTVGGYVGADADHLRPIPMRTLQPLGSPIQLFTGDYRTPITSSWQNNGRFYYRQTDPLPVTILAAIPNVEQSNL